MISKGIIAARDNNKCGVGVAFRASIASIRVLGDSYSDSNLASALLYHYETIDIYSNSYGPEDNGYVYEHYPLARKAIEFGAKNGRFGLGNIYVWAAGNGRMHGDDSNYDELANSIYTIAVASSDWNGKYSAYSEPGSNILVNAPSSSFFMDGANKKRFSSIYTTDRLGFPGYDEGDCTTSFEETSAAAPIVSGIIALMLQARSSLSWTDVQHILVRTAIPNNLTDPGWNKNGAGRWFNRDYGFGRVDAESAVRMAETMEKHFCPYKINITDSRTYIHGLDIPQDVNNPQIISFTVKTEIIVEHVMVRVSIQHKNRGQGNLYGKRKLIITSLFCCQISIWYC